MYFNYHKNIMKLHYGNNKDKKSQGKTVHRQKKKYNCNLFQFDQNKVSQRYI